MGMRCPNWRAGPRRLEARGRGLTAVKWKEFCGSCGDVLYDLMIYGRCTVTGSFPLRPPMVALDLAQASCFY